MQVIKKNFIFLITLVFISLIIIWNYSTVRLISIQSNTKYLYTLYGLLVFISLTSLFLVYFVIFKLKIKISLGIIASISIFILGILYTIYLAPLSAPDEPSHYISAYKLSNLILLQPITNEKGYVLIRGRDLSIENPDASAKIIKEKDVNIEYIKKSEDTNSSILYSNVDLNLYNRIYNKGIYDNLDIYQNNLAKSSYIPVNTTALIYIPQALGLSLARNLNLDSISLLFMARIFNLIFFAIIIGLSIHLLPFFKESIYIISLFPMSLNLAASFSYDALLISLIFLFIAYILNLRYKKEEISYKNIIFLAILLSIFAPCKIVYTPLIALILLLPYEKFKNKKNYIVGLLSILIIAALAMYLVNYTIIKSYVIDNEANISANVSTAPALYNIKYLLTHIREFISLYYLTILKKLEFYHQSMLGTYIGNIDFDITNNIGSAYICSSFISIALVLSSLDYKDNIDRKLGLGVITYNIFIFLLSSFLIMLSMLIACTPMSSNIILGVQGRYFIPILPLILLGFRNFDIKIGRNIKKELVFLVYATNIYVIINIFTMAIVR